jgi:hypothetical protein
MLLILPIAVYALWFFFFEGLYVSRREAALVAAAWWTLALVVLTEVLSLDQAIAQRPLAIGWFCVTGLLAALVVIARRRRSQGASILRDEAVKSTLGGPDWLMLTGALLICAAVGVTAAVSPPNGSDQLQYHLPRVAEWASRHSVRFFPTHYYVQLFAPPLAEWMMLHSYVLTGGDRFVGLVQWVAFVGSCISVSLIAKELGANLRCQILAAFLCVTLPQGILAASGAKNDWILSFWLSAVVFFLLRWLRDPSWLSSCNVGISVGSALLSKGTVYAFLPPIAAAILISGLRTKWRIAFQRAPLVLAMIVLLNGMQWARNYSLGGSIVGLSAPDVAGKEKYTVDRITLPGIASNLLRELAMQMGTPVDSVNQRETKIVRAVISRMGVDPDDRALTNYANFEIPRKYFQLDEYYAGNPLHLALAVFAFAALLVAGRRRSAAAAALALGIMGGFVLYCSLFKWEIWCARLHLPLLVADCAVVALVVYQRFPKLVVPLALILLALAIRPALCNETRPLLFSGTFHNWIQGRTSILLRSRPELYFTQQGKLKDTYLPAAEAIRRANCGDIGMDTSVTPYSHEYPLIELGKNPGRESTFRYLDVHNLSSKYADRSDLQVPCLVVCPDCRDRKDKWEEYSTALPVARAFGNLMIFSRAPSAATSQPGAPKTP